MGGLPPSLTLPARYAVRSAEHPPSLTLPARHTVRSAFRPGQQAVQLADALEVHAGRIIFEEPLQIGYGGFGPTGYLLALEWILGDRS